MELEKNTRSWFKLKKSTKLAVSFFVLFSFYHLAEYMIIFRNNATGFLIFQLLFFLSAFLLGNWYNSDGLAVWGLTRKLKLSHLLMGIILGIAIYAVPYFISVATGNEIITEIPNFTSILSSSLPFAFGVLFSSFSEDILTRGLIFAGFKNKLKPFWLGLLSALVYLLNHIYRLADGPEAWLYLFLLGIIFVIPLLYTRQLWLTGMMHWAGNLFFFIAHEVITTETSAGWINPNYLFSCCLILFIPVVWFISKRLVPKRAEF
ncbi:MAG: CPBP family intramembrane glutamic endopeptidase [Salegentibacter sp.]